MKQIHHKEKEQFKKLFEQEKVDRFEDRFNILEIFLKYESHLTVSELDQLLRKNNLIFEEHFIRDTLKLMCRFGFAQKMSFNGEAIRYEHHHLGQHHDHMICTQCGNIVEFKDERLENNQNEVAMAHGFHMLQHKMEIYGICADCRKDPIRQMPLTMAKPGEKLIIRDFSGGSNARMRLLTMGLRIGDPIEVVTNQGAGQLVVSLDFNRYVIGRGMAEKIMVVPVEGQ
jgi:Fur family transcriptional regulator, ferric uptake regulator